MTKFLWTDTIGGDTWDASSLRLWSSDWYEEFGIDDMDFVEAAVGGIVYDVASISGLGLGVLGRFGYIVDVSALNSLALDESETTARIGVWDAGDELQFPLPLSECIQPSFWEAENPTSGVPNE